MNLFFSWDSTGCESGIVLCESVEQDDSSRNIELLSQDGDASTPVERWFFEISAFATNSGTVFVSIVELMPILISQKSDNNWLDKF